MRNDHDVRDHFDTIEKRNAVVGSQQDTEDMGGGEG